MRNISYDLAKIFSNFVGGLLMLPQKHKEAKKFQYKSGFFITTNVYPDFGDPTDCQAIRKRLSLFNTTALPSRNAFVTGS